MSEQDKDSPSRGASADRAASIAAAGDDPPSREASADEKARIVAGKHRALQVAPTRRKLFTPEMKQTFLEWLAATCNVCLVARKTGIHYRTAGRHRNQDPRFAQGWALGHRAAAGAAGRDQAAGIADGHRGRLGRAGNGRYRSVAGDAFAARA